MKEIPRYSENSTVVNSPNSNVIHILKHFASSVIFGITSLHALGLLGDFREFGWTRTGVIYLAKQCLSA